MPAKANESSVITGAYLGLWNSLDMGVTESGYRLFHTHSGTPIISDMFGTIVLDQIYSGTVATISFVLENWNAQAIEPMAWWVGNTGETYNWGQIDNIGLKHWEQARPLVLTSCFGSDPAQVRNSANPTLDPVDIVFPKTLLRPDQQIENLFSGTQPRYIDMTLDIFPVDAQLYESDPQNPRRPTSCQSLLLWKATRNDISTL